MTLEASGAVGLAKGAAGATHPSRATKWRILRDPPASGAWNMAVDVALARTLRPREGVLRIYEWSRPTLSFGRNQPARERFEHLPCARIAAERGGLDVVRRPTGGREVLHDRELTYSVVAPLPLGLTPREVYGVVTAALTKALRSLGIPARVSPTCGRVPELGSGPCFSAPGAGEIEVEGRKLVGSAQVRIGGALLQHGSLPIRPTTAEIPGFEESGITVAEALSMGSPEPPLDRVAAALEGAVSEALPGTWTKSRLMDAESEVAKALLPYYESPSWTWRR